MFFKLFLLFTLIPVIDLFVLIKTGQIIGAFTTIFIVIFTGIIGANLAKQQGFSIIMKIQESMSQGKMPTKELLHGLMVFAGGILLLTPGFLTDATGFLLLIPVSREFFSVLLVKYFSHKIKSGNFQYKVYSNYTQDEFTKDDKIIEHENIIDEEK